MIIMRNGHGTAGDDSEFLTNILYNLSQNELSSFYGTVAAANICYSMGLKGKNTPEQQAKAIFKREKEKSRGKLKKLYAAMQKAQNLKAALDIHYFNCK